MKLLRFFTPTFPRPATLLLVASLLTACNNKSETPAPIATASAPKLEASAPAAAATPSGPPISVTTVRAQKRDLPVLINATGTVASLSSVEVKSQVTSVISKVHFKEGQFVRKGELLFTLDSRTDEANVAKAQAQLARDKATLADAQRQLERSKQLLAQGFISQSAVDTSQALVDAQTALIVSDQAAINSARVPLSYARITATSAGRAGAIAVFPGSAVQANQTSLVTLTQLDPIAVAFNLPQRNLADALAALKNGGTPVTATLPDKGGTLTGRLQFVDNMVDAASGTVKVKAVMDNRNGKLWPGAFVDVAMTVSTLKDAVIVPQATIVQAARGTIVYVVEAGKAASRPIKILYSQGEDAAVTGVTAGEAIVLDGRQNMRPGAAVVEREPKPAALPAKP